MAGQAQLPEPCWSREALPDWRRKENGDPFTLCPALQRAAAQPWTGRSVVLHVGCTTPSIREYSWLYWQVPTTSRGEGKGPASQRDGASPPAFPDSADEGASKHQPLQRWDSKQLFCDQDSNRLQNIHLDTFIF